MPVPVNRYRKWPPDAELRESPAQNSLSVLKKNSCQLGQLHLNIYPARQFQLGQCIHCLLGRGVDLDQALMRAQLELLTRLFVDVRRTQDGENLFFRGQRNRASYYSTTVADRLHDFFRRFVDQVVVLRAEFDTNFLIHNPTIKFVNDKINVS